MTTSSNISPKALEELQNAYLRVEPPVCARRLWERVLTPAERERLGGDLAQAFSKFGTVGMWKKLRGVSGERALIDVAKRLNFLDENTEQWLLREIGDLSDDPEAAIAEAVATGDLVLVDSPRTAYWEGKPIEIDWVAREKLWSYLWELGWNSKAGKSIDSFTFGEHASADYVVKQKSRLSNFPGFPVSLSDRIVSAGIGSQRLDLPAEHIRLFEMDTIESLRERVV